MRSPGRLPLLPAPVSRAKPSERIRGLSCGRWALQLAVILAAALALSPFATGETHASVPASFPHSMDSGSSEWGEVNCTSTILSSVSVGPSEASTVGLTSQLFRATALSSCGTNVSAQTQFAWSLLPTALGELSAGTGPTTLYTACISPMSGTLRLTASLGGVVRSTNVSITVVYDPSPGGNSPHPTSSGSVGSSASGIPIESIVVVSVSLILLGLLGGVSLRAWVKSGAARRDPDESKDRREVYAVESGASQPVEGRDGGSQD